MSFDTEGAYCEAGSGPVFCPRTLQAGYMLSGVNSLHTLYMVIMLSLVVL